MSFYKIKPGDLIKGAAIDWSKVSNGAQQPLTQDEVAMDKYDTNGEVINIGKKQTVPSRTMPKRDVPTGLDMPVRSADGSAQIWRPSRVTTEAERQHAADTAKRVGDAAASWVGSDAGKSAVQAVGNQGGATTAATAINYPTVNSYDRMLEFLGKQQQIDADSDKRARRREMIAAIGDGISALSSLYQATQGAPVTYTYGQDMSEVMRKRYDRLLEQRKADSDKYLNYLKMQAARDDAALDAQYKARRLATDEEREKREARRLDETERHNRELEKFYATKEQNNKEAKAAEQDRKNKDSDKKNEREEKKAEAYVEAQKKKGSGTKKGSASKTNKKKKQSSLYGGKKKLY